MRILTLLALALLVGCPTSAQDDDDATAPEDWTLQIVNDSGVAVDTVEQRPCPSTDDADWSELALPPDGIPTGSSWRWLLPTPGCFALAAQGGGCYVGGQTDPLQSGDQYTWTLVENDLLCVGG